MKLLVITQSVDKKDPALSFFHEWIVEFAKHVESIVVICLKVGDHDLPKNVKVLSLGKESGQSRIKYIWNFYKYIWKERRNYDSVFVHMNQEYVLLGWKIWFLMRKPVYLWRNHHAGNLLTDIAAIFCRKVFCTSKFSYTAKYKNTVLMPIGVDIQKFNTQYLIPNEKRSVLFLARMAPVKRPDLLVDALHDLKDKGMDVSASFYGDPLPKDEGYYESLRNTAQKYGLSSVRFEKGVPNDKTPEIYASHQIFVNLSTSGMYDKTIIEAMASGCLVLASNENLRGEIDEMFIFKEGDREDLVSKFGALLSLSPEDVAKQIGALKAFAERHSLKALGKKLSEEITL